METKNYEKEERFDAATVEALRGHYSEILRLLGENPAREGLLKTPERVAKAMSFLTKGYDENPLEILRSAMFHEEYKQMVLVKDIELSSMTTATPIGLSASWMQSRIWTVSRSCTCSRRAKHSTTRAIFDRPVMRPSGM